MTNPEFNILCAAIAGIPSLILLIWPFFYSQNPKNHQHLSPEQMRMNAHNRLVRIEEQKLAEMQKQTREIQMMHNNQTIYKHQWK